MENIENKHINFTGDFIKKGKPLSNQSFLTTLVEHNHTFEIFLLIILFIIILL